LLIYQDNIAQDILKSSMLEFFEDQIFTENDDQPEEEGAPKKRSGELHQYLTRLLHAYIFCLSRWRLFCTSATFG
jgi:hypothetical protein